VIKSKSTTYSSTEPGHFMAMVIANPEFYVQWLTVPRLHIVVTLNPASGFPVGFKFSDVSRNLA